MADGHEIEQLIQRITDLVMARLGKVAGSGARRGLLLLLPMPSAGLAELAKRAEQLRRAGFGLRTLASRAALEQIERGGLRARLGPELACPDEAGLAEALAGSEAGEVVILGSLGFALAGRLRELADDDPWVRLCTRAALSGHRVILVCDDLRPRRTGTPLADRAEALLGELSALGLEPIDADGLPQLAERLARAQSPASRALGELVTESDVEAVYRSGLSQLVLTARAIVTPLARSRAAELGLEIVEGDRG
ncbi:MAG: hypothetical protein JXR96_30210 [Deltaproteobacteria bacterium]|nr:hypothetical protein [Deltaproteobacteria bacterium]